MVPSIGRFQSCRYFLMTCLPGELSWHLCFTRDRPSNWLNHASGFHLLQCASCSRFAVKRHGSSSPSPVFRTSPCLHNGPSAQHVWCSLGKVAGRIWSLVTAQQPEKDPGASPSAYCVQLPVFCSAEVTLAPTSWSILSCNHSVC